MSSIESLSWHTAASVSDNYESNTFITKLDTENAEKNSTQKRWENGCLRWNVKTAAIRPRTHLKIPWIIILISLMQIVVHYIGCDDTINAFTFTPTKKHEVWRFFSYVFLHSGPVHLYSNIFLQILVAVPMETEQGHFRVLALYFGGVAFGALGSALVNPQQSLVGASAGVYSLLISHISHGILNWSTLSHRVLRIIAVIVMCCSDIVFICLYRFYGDANSIPKISFAAHSCGALAGFLFGFAVFHRSKECSGRFNYYRLISIIILICIVAVSTRLLFAK